MHALMEFCLPCRIRTTPIETYRPRFPVSAPRKYSKNLKLLIKQSKCANFLDVYDFFPQSLIVVFPTSNSTAIFCELALLSPKPLI